MENQEKKTECVVMKDGPYMIKGNFKIIDAQGTEIESADPAFLCRCGHSNNRPFCDGKHRDTGFKG